MALSKLSALTHLTIYAGKNSDLALLTNLPALTSLTLNLSGGGVSDLTQLTKLPALYRTYRLRPK